MALSAALPILKISLPQQQYTCHNCAGCCRDFTVQLRESDITKLDSQNWYEKLGEVPYIEFRKQTYLKQTDDGACIFLQDDGLCRIHAEYGLTQKPIACQMFPFTLMPTGEGIQTGISYACPSMINNRGNSLDTHFKDVRRLAVLIPELHNNNNNRHHSTPDLTEKIPDTTIKEVKIIAQAIDQWMQQSQINIHKRVNGAILLTSLLRQAKLKNVRGDRFRELLNTLLDLLPTELEMTPIAQPTVRHHRQIRQVVFAHVEDPKLSQMQKQGIRMGALKQLFTNYRFSRGKGNIPFVNSPYWPKHAVSFNSVESIEPISVNDSDTLQWVDSLLTRYIRARILGNRAWGSGYYGFSIISGLEALWLMLAATGWLARLYSAAESRTQISPADIERALIRTDRAAGRAPWLGRAGEKLRLKYLSIESGLLGLHQYYRLVDT